MLSSLVTLGRRADADQLALAISEQLASNRWHSTQSVSYALMSLASFARGSDIGTPVFEYTAGRASSARVTMDAPVETYPLAVPDSGSAFSIRNTAARVLYANIAVVGTPERGVEQASAEGLRVKVRYRDLDGNTVNVGRLRQGEDFIADVSVTNEGDANLADLALSQILPSGWEILNTRLDTEEGLVDATAELDYVREDACSPSITRSEIRLSG